MNISLIIFGLLAVVAGALAASNIVIERLPNAKQYIEKMVPYQAIIGVIAMILSVLKVFDVFTAKEGFFTNVIILGCVVATAIVGFLLGFPMVQQWIASDEKSKEKAEDIRKKLLPYQVVAGLVGIGAGIYLVLAGLVP
jgi:hypothetical protein